MSEVGGGQFLDQCGVRLAVAPLGGAQSVERAGKREHAQPGQVVLHPFELVPHVVPVAGEVLPRQCLGEGAGAGRPQLVRRGLERPSHHPLEVPQGLVPVEEDGLDHEATSTTLPNLAPEPKRS